MREKISVKKNILFSVSYQILLIVLPLITSPYISRTLGPEKLGIFSYTYSVANYFVLFAMLGMATYGTRTIAKVSNDRKTRSEMFCGMYLLQMTSAIISIVLYVGYLFFIAPDNTIIVAIQLLYVVSALFDISWFYYGISDFKIITIRNFLIKIGSIILIFCLVKSSDDLWIYAVIMCVGTLMSQLSLWIPLTKHVDFIRSNRRMVMIHIKPCLVLFSSSLAVSIYKVMDKIMLGIMSSYEQVAYYENAEKITNLPTGIIGAVGNVMLSYIVSMSEEEKQEYEFVSIKRTLFAMMPLAIGISCGIIAIAEPFSVVFFGNEFVQTGDVLSILAYIVIFLTWGNVLRTQFLLPHNMDKFIVFSVWSGALVNFCVNFFAIPCYGAKGAAIGTLLTEFIVALIVTKRVGASMQIYKCVIDMIPFGIFGYLMCLMIEILFEQNSLYSIEMLLLSIIVGAAFYCFLVGLYFVLLKYTKQRRKF